MALLPTVMVLVDISGYTRFITYRTISLIHAEQIITELLESVLDQAEFPLQLNKLEGDAAFLFAVVPPEAARTAVLRDVLAQVEAFFAVFARRREQLGHDVERCRCDACQGVLDLRLKAFIHPGEVLFKQVHGLEELAGEDVILLHRLLKNRVGLDEYILMSKEVATAALCDRRADWGRPHHESYDVGTVTLHLAPPPGTMLPPLPPSTFLSRLRLRLRFMTRLLRKLWSRRRPNYRHLPAAEVSFGSFVAEAKEMHRHP